MHVAAGEVTCHIFLTMVVTVKLPWLGLVVKLTVLNLVRVMKAY